MNCSHVHLEDIEKMKGIGEWSIYHSHDDWVAWCKFVGVTDKLRDATWNYYRVQYYCEMPGACKCGLPKK